MSPIENVWAWMQGQIDKEPVVATFATFKEQMYAVWARLPRAMLVNLMASMPGRLETCIARDGRHVGY